MQEHSTKVFKGICDALSKFSHSMLTRESSQFHASSSSTGGPPSSPTSEKALTQSGFSSSGLWIPVPNISQTNLKPI